jgi:4-hydroxybenzoate polyprenyltransferase
MGIALWLGCALVVFFVARVVPYARPVRWIGELLVALAAAMALGFVATALDFGGWKELDWRAALFVFLGAAAMPGALRLLRILITRTARKS